MYEKTEDYKIKSESDLLSIERDWKVAELSANSQRQKLEKLRQIRQVGRKSKLPNWDEIRKKFRRNKCVFQEVEKKWKKKTSKVFFS